MRGTLAVSLKQCLTLALLVGGPGSAENEVMPTPPANHQKRVFKADPAAGRLHSRCVDQGPSGPQIDDAEERDDAADDADAYTRDALLHLGPTDDEGDQDDAADDAADGAAADEMQSSWTPTVAMQTETSIGMPQMMQNNEMMPHMMMQNLKQEMLLRMEMNLRRRSI